MAAAVVLTIYFPLMMPARFGICLYARSAHTGARPLTMPPASSSTCDLNVDELLAHWSWKDASVSNALAPPQILSHFLAGGDGSSSRSCVPEPARHSRRSALSRDCALLLLVRLDSMFLLSFRLILLSPYFFLLFRAQHDGHGSHTERHRAHDV